MNFNKFRDSRVLTALTLALAGSFLLSLTMVSSVSAQTVRPMRQRTALVRPAEPVEAPIARDEVERAIGFVCNDGDRDPLGSMPIDTMQARPSLSLNHPDAVSSAQRARRLLPRAKELAVRALRKVAAEYDFNPYIVAESARRIEAVTMVKADPELRDNASVLMSNPRVINFGTIFLVGLPSDEGMISVLSHELTHIADGKEGSLAGLFARIGRRATLRTGLKISGQKAEELGCDLVGAWAVQHMISDQSSVDESYRRLARAIEHNCVSSDETDDEHLSPRNTMRALLSLDPTLARVLLAGAGKPMRVGTVSQQINFLVLPIPG